MACIRCGNKSYKGSFPYCKLCHMCLDCVGTGVLNGRPCKNCCAVGYVVKQEKILPEELQVTIRNLVL